LTGYEQQLEPEDNGERKKERESERDCGDGGSEYKKAMV
jgi:hypothetical protein